MTLDALGSVPSWLFACPLLPFSRIFDNKLHLRREIKADRSDVQYRVLYSKLQFKLRTSNRLLAYLTR